MKKKIIIGVSALLVVITSIVIYILVILSPYRNIDNLKEYLYKDDAKYEATIEYSSSYDGTYIDTNREYEVISSYTRLYNRVANYKFSVDTVEAYHYADFESVDGEYVTNELYTTYFYEQTETEAVKYSCILTGEEQYSSNAIWSKEILWDGDIVDYQYTSCESMYRYVDLLYSEILSSINLSYKEVDGIYYQALNGVKIVDNPTTAELKANKAIFTINEESGDSTVITLSKLKTTKVKSPLPDDTNDGFIFDYNEDSDSYSLIDYTGNSTSVEIPETYNDGINGEKVVDTIEQNCFWNSTKMKSIMLQSSVTKIGYKSFFGCSSLENVTISKKLTYIAFNAFENCDNLVSVYYGGNIEDWCNIDFNSSESSPMYYAKNFYMKNSETNEYEEVTSIEIVDAITYISWVTFCGFDNLESITLPTSITYIGSYAFYGCSSLESIIIPSGVTYIGYNAFESCDSLKTIYVKEGFDSSLFSKFPDGVTIEYYY